MHKHTNIHTFMHIHLHTETNAHTNTHIHVHTLRYIHMHTYTHIHAHVHTRTCTCTHNTHIVLSITMPKYSNRTVSNICSNIVIVIMLVITSSACGKYIHFNIYLIVIRVKILLHCPVHIPGSMVPLSIVIIVIHDSKQLIM